MSSSIRQFSYPIASIPTSGLIFVLLISACTSERQKNNDKVASNNEQIVSEEVKNVISEENTEAKVIIQHKINGTKSEDTLVDFYPHIDENSRLFDSLKMVMNLLENENEIIIEEKDVLLEEPVKKDQLVKVGSIPFYDKSKSEEWNKTDSLLSKNSGIKLETNPQKYEVEYWQSPLNTKGYRVGKNKLAVYGITSESVIALYQLESGLFLKTENAVFRLEKSPQFRNFVKENNQEILKQLH